MPKTKAISKTGKTKPRRKTAAAAPEQLPPAPEDQIYASNLTLHDLFQQQTAKMLEHADLSDEQKQSLLIGISCPCCGAGGFSFTAKLKR